MNPFVGSSRIQEVISLSRAYNCRPSELMGLEEPYEAFCFDEACAFIQIRIEEGDTPKFKKKYRSFTELYKAYE